MGHNVFAHLVLGAVLFAVSMLVFDGAGLYSTLLFTTAEVSGTLLGTGDNFGAEADNLERMIPVMAAVIINIIVYYIAAGIIIFIFDNRPPTDDISSRASGVESFS